MQTILLGDIQNKTRVVSTSEFEQFQTRFRGLLVNSSQFKDRLRFRRNRMAMDRIRTREQAPAAADPLGEGTSSGRAASEINPDYTFILSGEMYRTARQDSALYSLSLQLYDWDGNLIWQNRPYDFKQGVWR